MEARQDQAAAAEGAAAGGGSAPARGQAGSTALPTEYASAADLVRGELGAGRSVHLECSRAAMRAAREAVQEGAWQANQAELGRVVPVLVEGTSKRDAAMLTGKSPKNQTVHAPLPAGLDAAGLVGAVVDVRVDEARTWYLAGTVEGAPRP